MFILQVIKLTFNLAEFAGVAAFVFMQSCTIAEEKEKGKKGMAMWITTMWARTSVEVVVMFIQSSVNSILLMRQIKMIDDPKYRQQSVRASASSAHMQQTENSFVFYWPIKEYWAIDIHT